MLYPLSYEGGDTEVQVTPYAQRFVGERRVRFQPVACPFER